MADMRIVDGLKAVGFSSEDIPALVKGTLPQVSVCLSVCGENRIYTGIVCFCGYLGKYLLCPSACLSGSSSVCLAICLAVCLPVSYLLICLYVCPSIPQHRVTKLSPRTFTEEQLAKMFEDSLTVYK